MSLRMDLFEIYQKLGNLSLQENEVINHDSNYVLR